MNVDEPDDGDFDDGEYGVDPKQRPCQPTMSMLKKPKEKLSVVDHALWLQEVNKCPERNNQ